jgi:hypothetical protein
MMLYKRLQLAARFASAKTFTRSPMYRYSKENHGRGYVGDEVPLRNQALEEPVLDA